MSKKPRFHQAALLEQVRAELRVEPKSAKEVCQRLKISQAAFSRAVSALKGEVLPVGSARRTRYALCREIPGVGKEIPVFEVDESGQSARAGTLASVHPRGFVWNASILYADLPYFLEDLRPAGFLGRLVPRQHPQLEHPTDIRFWSADHCLRYLTRFGWNLIGSWVVGEESFRLHVEKQRERKGVPLAKRAKTYAAMAADVLQFGEGGSSAAGEQPKFLTVKGPRAVPVIVKFSPRERSAVARRRADLLVCEAVALAVLDHQGIKAAKAELLEEGWQTFLELERFDRFGKAGRRGLISLRALDLEHVGVGDGWTKVARALAEKKIIDQATVEKIEWLELFGRLTGNSDMHLGNLSFYLRGIDLVGLAPVYDMLPMLYAPQNEQLVERNFAPRPPLPSDARHWESACAAAREFWKEVGAHDRVSAGFRKIARENEKKLAKLAGAAKLLPKT